MTQITKRAAKKLFAEGKPFALCAVKMRPGPPSNPEYRIGPESIAELKERAANYAPNGIHPSIILWDGDIDTTAWNLMYNHWAACNTSHDEGYYAAYYVD